MEKYGEAHREAKAQRLSSLSERAGEITGHKGQLDGHHIVPLCFGGNDGKQNCMILQNVFHQEFHDICNVKDPERFRQRAIISKAIYRNPLSHDVEIKKQKIEAIDDVLIPQFIENLTTKFHHSIQEKLTQLTLTRTFMNVRDLNMRNRELEYENMKLKRELEELRNRIDKNEEGSHSEDNHKSMEHIQNGGGNSVFYPFHI